MLNTVNTSLYDRSKKSKLYIIAIIANVTVFILIILLIGSLFFRTRYTNVYVVGNSMMPTLKGAPTIYSEGGDYVYVENNSKPDYFDIVIVDNGGKPVVSDGATNIIKRVVAFGGDTVKIVRGQLYVKRAGEDEFKIIDESAYIFPEYNHPALPKNTFEEHTVAEGYLFLLGDNRDDSNDSRNIENGKGGDFPESWVFGVVPDWSVKHKNFITGFFTRQQCARS